MTRLYFLIIPIFLFSCNEKSDKPKWAIKATYHEGCSCNAPCPCPFGLPITNSHCKLNGFLDVHEGQCNGVNLKGVKVILSGEAGSWGEYYFSDSTTNEQKAAMESILKVVNVTGFDTVLVSKKTNINYKNQAGTITYSTANINVVMDMVKGKNDQPVVVNNLN